MKKLISLLLCAVLVAIPALAVPAQTGSEVNELSLETAIEKAKKFNNELITLNENRAVIDESIERTGQILEWASIVNEGLSFTSDYLYSNLLSSAKSQMNLAMNNQNKQQQEDMIEISINQFFSAIIGAQDTLDFSRQALEIENKELNIEKKKLELGLTSKSNVAAKQNAYNKSLASIKDNERLVNEAYDDLNYYMNEDAGKRYNLLFDITYEPIDVNLENHIITAIANSPSILQKAQELELAELDLKVSTDSSGTWTSRTNKVNQTNRALGNAKKDLEEKIRKTYDNIKKLEEQIAQYDEDEKNTQQNIAIKEVQYKNGMITALELEKAKFELIENEAGKQKLIMQHYLEKLSFEKPY